MLLSCDKYGSRHSVKSKWHWEELKIIISETSPFSYIAIKLNIQLFQPATVSRCGMIYLQPSSMGWRPLFTSWLASKPEVLKKDNGLEMMHTLFEWCVDECLRFVNKQCKAVIPTGSIHLVKNLTNIIDMIMNPHLEKEDVAENRNLKTWFQSAWLFAMPWSIGGLLDFDSRQKFDVFFRDMINGKNEQFPIPKEINRMDVMFPDNGLVYDYFYEVCCQRCVVFAIIRDVFPE